MSAPNGMGGMAHLLARRDAFQKEENGEIIHAASVCGTQV